MSTEVISKSSSKGLPTFPGFIGLRVRVRVRMLLFISYSDRLVLVEAVCKLS